MNITNKLGKMPIENMRILYLVLVYFVIIQQQQQTRTATTRI